MHSKIDLCDNYLDVYRERNASTMRDLRMKTL